MGGIQWIILPCQPLSPAVGCLGGKGSPLDHLIVRSNARLVPPRPLELAGSLHIRWHVCGNLLSWSPHEKCAWARISRGDSYHKYWEIIAQKIIINLCFQLNFAVH